MKIVLATPLYPPEVAEPAPYVKELARRLMKLHSVAIVAYGRLPEQVPGVTIRAINKHRPLFWRLTTYFLSLWRVAKDADIIYMINGASVELAVTLVSILTNKPFVVCLGDPRAHKQASRVKTLGVIERFALSRARGVLPNTPIARPEILPLSPYPTEAYTAYEQSWSEHIQRIDHLFLPHAK